MAISFQCEKYRAFGSKNVNEVPVVKYTIIQKEKKCRLLMTIQNSALSMQAICFT
jgi:hypothetical protein